MDLDHRNWDATYLATAELDLGISIFAALLYLLAIAPLTILFIFPFRNVDVLKINLSPISFILLS